MLTGRQMAATLAHSGGMLPRDVPGGPEDENDDGDDDDPPGDVRMFILPNWAEHPFQQQGNRLYEDVIHIPDKDMNDDDDDQDAERQNEGTHLKFTYVPLFKSILRNVRAAGNSTGNSYDIVKC